MKRKSLGREGFTLIELLVVIAIIAILAAILFPVFARAREKARIATCQTQTKELATAILMYAQDYDEKLVRYADPQTCRSNPSFTRGRVMWYEMITPYTGEQSKERPQGWDLQLRVCPTNGRGGSIGVVYPHVVACGWGDGVVLGSIRRPGECALLMDSGLCAAYEPGSCFPLVYCGCIGGWGNQWACAPCVGPNRYRSSVAPRHNNGANVAFADGHVKWMRIGNRLTEPLSWIFIDSPQARDFWNH